jgi:hypothetical protein
MMRENVSPIDNEQLLVTSSMIEEVNMVVVHHFAFHRRYNHG